MNQTGTGPDTVWYVGGRTPLMNAALSGNGECVRLLLKVGAEVNACDKNGVTALMCAATVGSAHCMKLLLDAGTDVNHSDKKKMTALSRAAEKKSVLPGRKVFALAMPYENAPVIKIRGEFAACMRMLVKSGADVNHVSAERKTPIMYAASSGDTNQVKLLLELGATLERGGKSILGHPAEIGDLDMMKYLVSVGANVNATDAAGYTPLMCACMSDEADRENFFGCYLNGSKFNCVKFLLESGADVNKWRDTDYQAAMSLTFAVMNRDTKCVKLLLQYGASCNMDFFKSIFPIRSNAQINHTGWITLELGS